MRYYFRMNEQPDSKDYGKPQAVFRFDVTDKTVITERFDKKSKKWVDDPAMIALTGIGGDEDFKEIKENEANDYVQGLGGSMEDEEALETGETGEAGEQSEAFERPESDELTGDDLPEELNEYFTGEKTDQFPIDMEALYVSQGISAAATTEMWYELARSIIASMPRDVQKRIATIEMKIREESPEEEEYEVEEGEGLENPPEEDNAEELEGEIERQAPEETEALAIDDELFSERQPVRGDENPTVTLVAGLSSSGKSSYLRKLKAPNTVIIEPEEIKASFEGYEGWNSALFADEAATKIEQMVKRAVDNRYNLIIENNFIESQRAKQIVEAFKEKGYTVNLVYIDVPMEDAMRRALARYQGKTGRYVSPMYLAYQDGKNIQTVEAIRDLVDNVEMLDNTQEKGQAMTKMTLPEKQEEPEENIAEEEAGMDREISEEESKISAENEIEESVKSDEDEEENEIAKYRTIGPLRMIARDYPAPHCGPPPGERGSSPREACAAGTTQAGLTSARPGKEASQIFEDMRKFEGELKAIEGVGDVRITAGLGGWEGGREPTWIIQYKGDGQAAELIGKTAKIHGQDAAILFEEVPEGEEGSPITDFIIDQKIMPDLRDKIEEHAVYAGIMGWTWMRTPDGKRLLRSACIPDYGGTEENHNQSVTRMEEFLKSLNLGVTLNNGRAKIAVLKKENDYQPTGGMND